MALDSMQEIFDKIQAGRKPFWQVVRDTDVEERQVTAEASFRKMHATWRAMVESVDTYRADRRSVSGLVGGDAQRMWDYAAEQETLCGPYLQEVIAPVLAGRLDMCIGSRFIKCEGFQTSFMRRVGIRFLSWLIHILCGQRILDVTSGFRATGPQLTAYFAEHYASDYPEPEAILAATLAGFRVGEAPVVMKERQGGVSSIRSFKSAYYMIKVSLSLIIDRLSIKKIHQPKSK